MSVQQASKGNHVIRHHIDHPIVSADGTYHGCLVTRLLGWAISKHGISAVRIHVNKSLCKILRKLKPRPDVAKDYPGYIDSYHSGIECELICKRRINNVKIVIIDNKKNRRVINLRITAAPMMYLIHEPASFDKLETWDLPFLVIKGWAISKYGKCRVNAFLNGKRLRRTYNSIKRPDVASQYAQLPGALYSGFRIEAMTPPGSNALRIELRDRKGNTINIHKLLDVEHTNFKFSRGRTKRAIKGINVAGYFKYSTGLGEAARSFIRALPYAKVKYSLFNIQSHGKEILDDSLKFTQTNNIQHTVNCILANAEFFEDGLTSLPSGFLSCRYNIGCWVYETISLPSLWREIANCFLHEIWTPSTYCKEIFRSKINLPVVLIPHPVDLSNVVLNKSRKDLSLPEDKYIFLMMFDYGSAFERKNPLAVIKSFTNAFSHNEKDTSLIIRCLRPFLDTSSHQAVRKLAAKDRRIIILEEPLSREQVCNFMNNCDCYVSLHRSEGFGLPLAEAMYLGKPVIATGYSGNMDFMSATNSFPVKYKLITTNANHGVYLNKIIWADPDVDHAIDLMRLVHKNKDLAKRVGQEARDYIKTNYSLKRIGQTIRTRVNEIYESLV